MAYIEGQRNHRNVGLSTDVVKFLSQPLHFTVVDITTDNWFTGSQLAIGFTLETNHFARYDEKKTGEKFTLNLQQEKGEVLDKATLVSLTGKR